MTHRVLDLKEISAAALQALLKDTYTVLTAFHQEATVPKELCGLFLKMEEYLTFASMMEEKEFEPDYYHYRAALTVILALEDGFLRGRYPCACPKLCINDRVFDLETDSLECVCHL